MINVGIIGTGTHGSRYANHVVNDIDSMQLVAISRKSEKGVEQASLWQTRLFTDWIDLINDSRVDAVIAVVTPNLNLAIAQECARVGKPLLMEKPLAMNSFVARQIVNIMAFSNCQLTVGQTLRYNSVIETLRKELPSMGKVFSFHANQRLEPSTLAWHDQKEIAGAGVLIHTAVHIFDALHYLTGKRITRVMTSCYKYHNKVLEDLVTILFEMEGGTVGSIDVSKVGKGRSGRLEFICDEGQLHGEQVHGYVEKIRNNKVESSLEMSPGNTIIPLLNDWSDFLNKKRKNPITGEDGLYAVEVCDACLRSSEHKEWVEV